MDAFEQYTTSTGTPTPTNNVLQFPTQNTEGPTLESVQAQEREELASLVDRWELTGEEAFASVSPHVLPAVEQGGSEEGLRQIAFDPFGEHTSQAQAKETKQEALPSNVLLFEKKPKQVEQPNNADQQSAEEEAFEQQEKAILAFMRQHPQTFAKAVEQEAQVVLAQHGESMPVPENQGSGQASLETVAYAGMIAAMRLLQEENGKNKKEKEKKKTPPFLFLLVQLFLTEFMKSMPQGVGEGYKEETRNTKKAA